MTRFFFVQLLLVTALTACGSKSVSSRLNDQQDSSPAFQSGDRFVCDDDSKGLKLTATILDVGDKEGEVTIRSTQSDDFFPAKSAVARYVTNGFSFVLDSNDVDQDELVIHLNTALMGKGTGTFEDSFGFRSVRCQLLSTDASRGYMLSDQVFATTSMPDLNKQDLNYVSLNIPYTPVNHLKLAIEKRIRFSLQDRREAHITVITPPEMMVLSKKLTKEQILELTNAITIQSETFSVQCLGKAQIKNNKNTSSTYFVVITSDGLVKRRANVERAYLASGGDPKDFRASHYFPHITIGFTERDLHESDGIIKDSSSCTAPLRIVY